ncbi:hypothetical protein [Amycolatopsis sp. NPDC051061]
MAAVGLATRPHSITGRPVVFDALARVTPTHYNAVLTRLMRRPRRTEAVR